MTMGLHSQVPGAKSIAFVSMGTGIYKWPMGLAADIALKALLTSTFDETFMCVTDEKTRLIYQAALDRYCGSNFCWKFFELYLPLNISAPPRWEGPPSPFYQSGTLFMICGQEPCHKMRAFRLHARRITLQDPSPSHHETIKKKAHETIENQAS